jgi:lipopolysaccharide assembly protein A
MRWLYIAIIVIFLLALVIFLFQNTDGVSVDFLVFGLTAPLWLVVLVVYVLGALTGGSVYGLLRASYQRSRAY